MKSVKLLLDKYAQNMDQHTFKNVENNKLSNNGACSNNISENYPLKNYLDLNLDISQYLLNDKILSKYSKILDIVNENDNRSCCFTKGYGHYVEGTGSVVQHNKDTDLESAFRNEGTEDERLEKIKQLQLRYFSPNEVLKLMCFPNWFTLPSSITQKQSYRVLGNSINVLVVTTLLLILINE